MAEDRLQLNGKKADVQRERSIIKTTDNTISTEIAKELNQEFSSNLAGINETTRDLVTELKEVFADSGGEAEFSQQVKATLEADGGRSITTSTSFRFAKD